MKSPKPTPEFISRSALAERLEIPLKDLTQLMIEAGWILQKDKKWVLTAKGEFDGGIYRQSKKYGEYIAWPVSLIEHPALRGVDEGLVNISSLAKQFQLPPRLLNRLLAEAGWIESFAKGWQLTSLGKAFAGVQSQDEDSGVPYVTWPRSIREEKAFVALVDQFTKNQNLRSLDGHQIKVEAHRKIADWLYLLGFSYAYQRALLLPEDKAICPDFYLPNHRLIIDCWPKALAAGDLAVQLEKRELYQQYELQALEISEENLDDLDHELSRQLIQHGISVY